MGRRLCVVLAALHEPRLLLLDEPFDGVDPIGVEATMDVIADARARGACILVSTHLRELAIQACTDVPSCAAARGWRPSTPPRWRGRRGPVPTGLSSTSAPTSQAYASPGLVPAARRAVADVGHLLRFRTATVRRRRALPTAFAIMGSITLAVCTLPALFPGAHEDGRARDVLLLMPTMFAAFFVLTVVSGVSSGGGRELISRDQGVTFPVSPTTDHLGALLLAPLNVAWLLQSWAILGSAAFALGPADAVPAMVAIVLWLLACTAMAQVVAWTMEAIRRRPTGGSPSARSWPPVRWRSASCTERRAHRLPRPPAHPVARRSGDPRLRVRVAGRLRVRGGRDRRRGRAGRRTGPSRGTASAA